jgi:periplasmic divalent cation tolerance protein
MELLAVFTTVSNEKQAEILATTALERQLAACVHIESVQSMYRWKGTMETDREVRLLLKTTRAKYESLEKLLLELHPYELPAIFALPVAAANSAYVSWVHESVSSAQGPRRDH